MSRAIRALVLLSLWSCTLQPAIPAPDKTKHVNRLIKSNSPYLLQHAHNPVDWYEWGPEAIKKAKAENKPILLSIGYASCHWCHVMEMESFHDPKIATLMNKNFICIKVDKEQNPSVDFVYQHAAQMMRRQTGWPLTVFLTPDLKPFYIDTYLEPTFFVGTMKRLAALWQRHRDKVVADANAFAQSLQSAHAENTKSFSTSFDAIAPSIMQEILKVADSELGGLGAPKKFPMPTIFGLMILTSQYKDLLPEAERSKVDSLVKLTLDNMANGELQDHLSGGFFRYCTLRRWQRPHFEKMLIDNAAISRLFLEGYRATGDEYWKEVAQRTLDFVLANMKAKDGGYITAFDADSEGREGHYYVFRGHDIEALSKKGLDTKFAATAFGVTAKRSSDTFIPSMPDRPDRLSKQLALTRQEFDHRLNDVRRQMLAYRNPRLLPEKDSQVVASYNGLMIWSFVEGYKTFADPRYLTAAKETGQFILSKMCNNGALMRSYATGRTVQAGELTDYAHVIRAFLELATVDLDGPWLNAATELTAKMLRLYFNEKSGTFNRVSVGYAGPSLRMAPTDNVAPSGAAAATKDLIILSRMSDDRKLMTVAGRLLKNYEKVYSNTFLQASFLDALDAYRQHPADVVAVMNMDSAESRELLKTIGGANLPHALTFVVSPQQASKSSIVQLAVVRGQSSKLTTPVVYVCVNRTCKPPAFDVKQLKALLARK